METNNVNNEATETQVQEQAPATEQTPAEEAKTYSQAELESEISRAVNAAVKKVKATQAKSNDELTAELNDLKTQLQRKDNESYVASEISSRGIPSSLQTLFYSDDNDDSKAKLNLFSKWFETAVNDEVEKVLNSTKTPQFGASKAPSKKSGDFLEFYAAHTTN